MTERVDFQALYRAYLQRRAAEFEGKKQEELDELATQLYEAWLQAPNEALFGKAPQHYFDDFGDEALIDALLDYADARMQPPDPLLDELVRRADTTAPLLCALLDAPMDEKRTEAVLGLLSEMQYAPMLPACLQLVLGAREVQAEQAAQAMMPFGAQAAELALRALPAQQRPEVCDRLADIVSSCGPVEGAREALIELFYTRPDARAFYAHCLSKLGDPSVVDMLMQEMNAPHLTYYDYLALRDAVEALGEVIEIEREFEADADYIRMKYEMDDDA